MNFVSCLPVVGSQYIPVWDGSSKLDVHDNEYNIPNAVYNDSEDDINNYNEGYINNDPDDNKYFNRDKYKNGDDYNNANDNDIDYEQD